MDVKVSFEGRSAELPSGATVGEALDALGAKKNAVGALVDGKPVDFHHRVEGDCEMVAVKKNTQEGLGLLRHTAAHVLAEAVQSLFPEAKVTIGPVIENGFYYDFDFPRGFTPEDLESIEARMLEITKKNSPVTRSAVSREDAVAMFSEMGESYKVEIINDLPEDEEITLYDQAGWYDLCRGPHVPETGLVRAFKLTSSAGAYWRGNENNPMLQRIYGTAFWNPKDLRAHLKSLEEAKKRDHRKLGRELDLFSVSEEIGPGLVLWHPRGATVRGIIEDFWKKEHLSRGYEMLYTPHMAKLDLWRSSGHVDFYRENMFSSMEVETSDYQIKPMNCPFHILVYKTRTRSYRDLPLRWAEIGTVYRYERSGVLHGLMRVRGFSQDDAHIFCRPDQIREEVSGVLALTMDFLRTFGFDDYEIFLSTRPAKFVGSEENWERSVEAHRGGASRNGFRLRRGRGRRGVLRSQDRPQDKGRSRQGLAVLHNSSRFQPARAVRNGVCGRGQRQARPDNDTPGDIRFPRAFFRYTHRALRGSVSPVAQSRAGEGGVGRPGARRLLRERLRDASKRRDKGADRHEKREARIQGERSADHENSLPSGCRGQGGRGRYRGPEALRAGVHARAFGRGFPRDGLGRERSLPLDGGKAA